MTRRAAVLALACAPAVALAGHADGGTPDPIFAAIEAHRTAYLARAVTGRIFATTKPSGPAYEAAEQADYPNRAALEDAELGLLDAVPTTMAGVLALLDYVHDFNHGSLRLDGDDDVDNWASNWEAWPAGGYETYEFDGDEQLFAWHLMEIVRTALRAIAVRGAQS